MTSQKNPAELEILAERLALHSIPEPNSGCLLWTSTVTGKGYALLGIGHRDTRREVRAHRLAYEVAKGPIPDGMQVLHKCDVPSCINPEHLFLGTNQDNMDDKVAKRRQPRGECAGNAKLTEAQVRAIRIDERPRREIARAFGLSPGTVTNIVNRKRWAHLPDEVA